MEAVDVLARVDQLDHPLGVDLLRQRQLHQDAVHRGIGVERAHAVEHLRLAGGRGKVERERPHARRLGHPALVAHVDLRRRVLADEDDGEPGCGATLRHARRDALAHVGDHPLGERLAVEDPRAHRVVHAGGICGGSSVLSRSNSARTSAGMVGHRECDA